jgi:hypothetical protein
MKLGQQGGQTSAQDWVTTTVQNKPSHTDSAFAVLSFLQANMHAECCNN